MNKKEKLEDLRQSLTILQEQCDEKSIQINRLLKEIWQDDNGVNIGDTISFIDGNEQKKGVLDSIDISWSSPKAKVKLFKKDRTLGTRTIIVWNAKSIKKLNSEQNPERSVATDDDSSTKADQ